MIAGFLFGFVPLTMIFAIAQMPLINRESRDTQKGGAAQGADAAEP